MRLWPLVIDLWMMSGYGFFIQFLADEVHKFNIWPLWMLLVLLSGHINGNVRPSLNRCVKTSNSNNTIKSNYVKMIIVVFIVAFHAYMKRRTFLVVLDIKNFARMERLMLKFPSSKFGKQKKDMPLVKDVTSFQLIVDWRSNCFKRIHCMFV